MGKRDEFNFRFVDWSMINMDDDIGGEEGACNNNICPWKEFITHCSECSIFDENIQPAMVISKIKKIEEKLKKSEEERLSSSRKNETIKKRMESLTDTWNDNERAYESKIAQLNEDLEMKEKKLEEMEEANRGLRKEKDDLEERYNTNLKRLAQLESDKDNIYVKWKEVIAQRDKLIKDQEINKPTDTPEDPANVEESWTPTFRQTSAFFKDIEVTLKKKNVKDQFGIRFGIKRGPALLNESNIIVVKIYPDLVRDLVRVNDFVIEINNVNVQNGNMETVKEVCSQQRETMTLKLRQLCYQPIEIPIQGAREQYQDWGLTLGVFIKRITPESYSHKTVKLREFDEISQVNDKKVEKLSLRDIYDKMNKRVKFTILRNETSVIQNETNVIQNETRSDIQNETGSDIPNGSIASSLSNRSSSERDEEVTCKPTSASSSLSGKQDGLIETIHLSLSKKDFESIGIRLAGGNKSGIFVDQVENWCCADIAGVQVGWRVLQMDWYDMREVALCYAVEVLTALRHATNIQGVFQKLSKEEYRSRVSNQSCDSFNVRALKDYKRRHDNEFSFKTGDHFLVIDSFSQMENKVYKWKAQKAQKDGQTVVKFLPLQLSKVIVRNELDLQGGNDNDRRKSPKKPKTDIYFDLLDNVDIRLVDSNVVVM